LKKRISGLYAITPEQPDTARLLGQVKLVLEGGANLLQYRSKNDDVALLHEQASELLTLCRSYHVPLIVNDNLRLADLIGADGVHLGREDASLREARIVLGNKRIVGVSCYGDLELARQAEQDGADYVAFGSCFSSSIKPDAPRVSLEVIQAARLALQVPIVAIGGITADNLSSLLRSGVDAVAIISALFDAADPALAASLFVKYFALPGKPEPSLH
jgi:thiamine-phosphate pyrophosphorylase